MEKDITVIILTKNEEKKKSRRYYSDNFQKNVFVDKLENEL